MFNSWQFHGLYSPWNSPGQNTGVGSCSLLQGVFPTQGQNPGLLHCRQILYHLSHQGSPYYKWRAYKKQSSTFRQKLRNARLLWTRTEYRRDETHSPRYPGDPKKFEGHLWNRATEGYFCFTDEISLAIKILQFPASKMFIVAVFYHEFLR